MSVYNPDNCEYLNGDSNRTSHGTNNGLQARYNQVESDFLNRNFASTTHSDMTSVQLTRPTSKIAMLVRQRRAMFEQLSCYLCKGYLIDATTIDECMDSFCKSCIVVHLQTGNNCPKCGVLIQKSNPISAIRSDKILQEIVYKLIPGLYDEEMRRRRDFYRGLYGVSLISSSDDENSSNSSNESGSNGLIGEKYGVIMPPKPFYKPSDSIDLSIEPQTRGDNSTIYYDNKRQSIVTCFTGNLLQQEVQNSIFSSVESQHFKTYLRCPAKLTVPQLKKFIVAKFNICRGDSIHLLYLNESLRDEYSLIDVAYIYDWRGIEHMRLFYKIERDLSQMACNIQIDGQSRASNPARQSVGISTQTVKRVCIDPQPKFYEEKNNNSIMMVDNESGRSMRSRVATSSNKSTSTQVTQASTNKSTRDNVQKNEPKLADGKSNGVVQQTASQNAQHISYRTCGGDDANKQPRSTKNDVKETRSLRSQYNVATLPKMSSRLDSHVDRNIRAIVQDITDHPQASNATQIQRTKDVSTNRPYSSRGTSVPPSTQSSLVSLASFTETRSNHITTTISSSSTTAATISDSYKNLLDTSSSMRRQDASSTIRDNHALKSQHVPQLAFSFVTERGITIVRRFNNQPELKTTSSGASNHLSVARSVSTAAVPSGSHSRGTDCDSVNNEKSQLPSSTSRSPTITSSSSPQASGLKSSGEGSVSPRHHIKVKPVYKTFVDPTKLKSPNFKKLGYTARH